MSKSRRKAILGNVVVVTFAAVLAVMFVGRYLFVERLLIERLSKTDDPVEWKETIHELEEIEVELPSGVFFDSFLRIYEHDAPDRPSLRFSLA